MRQVVKHISGPILKRFFKTYLNRATQYSYEGIDIRVEKGVFHPKYFFSTRVLLDFLKKQELSDKRILELGAGSGLISFFCAKKGARVTASDVNQTAIDGLKFNSEKLKLDVEIVKSDLFDDIEQTFDCIIINPPYYPKTPSNEAEKAWFCGEDFEYFQKLFSQLNERKETAAIWMILSEDCKIDHLKDLAEKHEIAFELIHTDQSWAEKNFIFQLKTSRL